MRLYKNVRLEGLLLRPVDKTEMKFERCGYFLIDMDDKACGKTADDIFSLKPTEPGQFASVADPNALRTITIV